jgi:hypothetical protein
MDIIIRPAGV